MALATNPIRIDLEDDSPSVRAGSLYWEPISQKTYVYVQVAAVTTAGQCLAPVGNGALINADVDAVAAITTRRITGTGDFTTTALAGSTAVGVTLGHILRILFDENGTGIGQDGIIMTRISDNAVDIYVESGGTTYSTTGQLATALTASNDYVVQCKTRVTPTTEPTDLVMGVAEIAITDEYWAWLCYSGDTHCLFDATDGAVTTDDRGVIPSTTTDGYCSGSAATQTTAEVAAEFGKSIITCSSDCLLPIVANCGRIWQLGTAPAAHPPTMRYPAWFRTIT